MQGLFGAIARLLVMGVVMGAVLAAAVFAGLATTTAIALGLVGAGLVGVFSLARRPRAPRRSAHDEIAAMMAPPASIPPAFAPGRPSIGSAMETMAPQPAAPVDPEANMPRWRRPSLLEARHADYSHRAPVRRMPMRFAEDADESEIRVVRYAVVPVLDRPDEVLGLEQSHLESGDEVQVIGASGAFIEVRCPNGDRGWVHRTTLGQPGGTGVTGDARTALRQEADDALNALLTARGLI